MQRYNEYKSKLAIWQKEQDDYARRLSEFRSRHRRTFDEPVHIIDEPE